MVELHRRRGRPRCVVAQRLSGQCQSRVTLRRMSIFSRVHLCAPRGTEPHVALRECIHG